MTIWTQSFFSQWSLDRIASPDSLSLSPCKTHRNLHSKESFKGGEGARVERERKAKCKLASLNLFYRSFVFFAPSFSSCYCLNGNRLPEEVLVPFCFVLSLSASPPQSDYINPVLSLSLLPSIPFPGAKRSNSYVLYWRRRRRWWWRRNRSKRRSKHASLPSSSLSMSSSFILKLLGKLMPPLLLLQPTNKSWHLFSTSSSSLPHPSPSSIYLISNI